MSITIISFLYICSNSLPNPPHIIMVMSDDMGYGDVHYNGGIALTPNFDEWIQSDHTIVFDRGYSGAPLCSPTRASVLTGRTGDRDCIYSANQCSGIPAWKCSQTMPLSNKLFTSAKAAKKSDYDYQTLLIGKFHLGDFWMKKGLNSGGNNNKASNPSMHGFDYFHSTEGNCATTTPNCGCSEFLIDGQLQENKCIFGHWKDKFDAKPWCKTYWYNNKSSPIGVTNISYIIGEDYDGNIENRRDTYYIMSIFKYYLDNILDLSKPIFVFLWLHAPHIEYIATPNYANGCINGTYCDLDRLETNSTANEIDYYGSIADIDDQIGRLRRMLKDYNLYNNTWVYYTSDNGPINPGLTNGMKGRKNDLFEGGIRVPSIMQWPGVIPKGMYNVSYPIYTCDFLPTVMEILGVESDTPTWDLDGISILNVLKHPSDVGRRYMPLKWNYLPNGWAYMDNDMKIVADHYNKDEIVYLFNITSDPYEMNDLSNIYPYNIMKENMLNNYTVWYDRVIKSQFDDTQCIRDRANSYWKIWLPIVIVFIGLGCGIFIICCLLVWCGVVNIKKIKCNCKCYEDGDVNNRQLLVNNVEQNESVSRNN